ncbi:hypothetical protein EDC04DRAFT_2703287 [Pisolithus marmoratus]|nr:hypothetical protein EDC04DRAFT_2703287 [Pisolithus marmoratus]
MRFTSLFVTASIAYGSAAMPVMPQLAVVSSPFNSVGAATDAAGNISSKMTVGGFQMSSAKIGAYSPSSTSILPLESDREVMYQSVFTSDFSSVSLQASQIVALPTALAITSPPAMPTFITPIPNPTASTTASIAALPAWTNSATHRAQGYSRGILGLAFICTILQVL